MVITVLILQTLISNYLMKSLIVNRTEAYFQETVNQIGLCVDLQIEQSKDMVEIIINNQVMKNYLYDLKHEKANEQILNYKITREVLKTTDLSKVENIYIFPLWHRPINCFYSKAITEADAFTSNLLCRDISYDENVYIWSRVNQNPYNISIFTFIYDNKEKLGLIQITFNQNLFAEILDSAKIGEEGTIYLTDANGNIIFTRDRSMILKDVPIPDEKYATLSEFELKNENWKIAGVTTQEEILSQINRFNNFFINTVLLLLFVVMIYAYASAYFIIRPLNKIVKGMQHIQKGDLNINLKPEKNEFDTIIRNFNYMVGKIKHLIETVYQQQVLYRQTEIQNLQSKMNTHFLYNTLDMMYWMLVIKDENEVSNVIVKLSDILRYSISQKDEYVTVREDMLQLENYLKIQCMRFKNKLSYIFNLQDEIMELKIPKLLIQPLIENAIKYAFEDMKHSGEILICGYLESEDLIFEVYDNGIGIPENKLKSIIELYKSDRDNTGIGITLVHQRARHIYGERYGVSIDSTLGIGTSITVRVKKKISLYKP